MHDFSPAKPLGTEVLLQAQTQHPVNQIIIYVFITNCGHDSGIWQSFLTDHVWIITLMIHTAGASADATAEARRRHEALTQLEVTRTLRQEMTVPILMVTARDDEIDRVIGLELGADDFLSKPVDPRELAARAAETAEARQVRDLEKAAAGFTSP